MSAGSRKYHARSLTPRRRPPETEQVSSLSAAAIRRCQVCGCTDDDCLDCIQRTGEPCRWVALDLCSACEPRS